MDGTALPYLEVHGVTKRFGGFTALEEVSFGAGRGEFLSILGPSGCGKTTLLRVVAGLETQSSGRVVMAGRDVSRLPVSRRGVGIVFQSYALFPNLTAGGNIAYGLRGKGFSRKEIRERILSLMDLVGLGELADKYPAQLSGGQQQRVALARAMALSPDLLLLDEPLSALDAQVRLMLRGEIRQLQQRLGVTTIMVTHDQEEALTMADRVLVMNRGCLVQSGSPREVYDRPATPFVAAFIGSMNFLPNAVKESRGLYRTGTHRLRVGYENGGAGVSPGEKATIAIRPEDVLIRPEAEEGPNTLRARVRGIEYRGSLFRIRLQIPAAGETDVIEADVPAEKVRRFGIRTDMDLSLDLPAERLHVYAGSAAIQAATQAVVRPSGRSGSA